MIDHNGGLCDRSSARRHATVAARLTWLLACLILVITPAGVLFGDALSATGEAHPGVQESAELQVGPTGSQPRRMQAAAAVVPVDDVGAPDVADPLVRGERALGFRATTNRLLPPLRGPPAA